MVQAGLEAFSGDTPNSVSGELLIATEKYWELSIYVHSVSDSDPDHKVVTKDPAVMKGSLFI